jgi:integrase
LRRLQNDGIEPTNDILKTEFDKIWRVGKNQTDEPTTGMELMGYISHFIKTSNVRESTKKSYRVVERDLKEYQSKKKTKLKFSAITIDFYNSFIKFMKSKGYAPNTAGTRIKVLKTFLSNAKDAGLAVNEDYKKRAFSKPKEETESIYLTETELMNMYGLNLKKTPKFDRTRDLFLIGCYTGLRFSDLSQLSQDNLQGDTISIRTIKTDTPVIIPLHPVVLSILKKHEYCLPKVPSNQKFNEYIKEISKLAGIVEPVRIEQTKGDMKMKKSEHKYNLVSSHTARRSFATNAFLSDIPSIQIMKITGHKTESSFMKYIKMSNEDNARKLKLHKFFSPINIAQ